MVYQAYPAQARKKCEQGTNQVTISNKTLNRLFKRRDKLQKRLHSALGYRSPNDFEELQVRDRKEASRQALITICAQS